MAISQKSLFKLSAYLDFSLEGRANMILNLEKLRNLFRKIAKFCAKKKQKADGEISLIDHCTMSL
jgi:hypothetical protein